MGNTSEFIIRLGKSLGYEEVNKGTLEACRACVRQSKKQ